MKISEDKDEPPSSPSVLAPSNGNIAGRDRSDDHGNIISWVRGMVGKGRQDTTLREALEEFIEDAEEKGSDTESITIHERSLISNVVTLRDMTVVDVMIPRADIIAIDINTSQADLLALLSEKQFSRIPVYRETLDDVVGTIHIKDILACLVQGRAIEIEKLIRDVPIVSPAMPVLDLILMMQQMRKHMALVVDEYGGIDGLVAIGDVIKAIIGEVEDEHNNSEEEARITENADGSLLVDARYDIVEFEEKYGAFLSEEEREDIDTIGGLIFAVAGRIPARGEVLTHTSSGLVFEIIDADPRRVNKVVIRNIRARQ